jgi:PleD family two-component response regulator
MELLPLNRALEQIAQQLAARESHLLEENRQIDHLAQVDGLTGIANREVFSTSGYAPKGPRALQRVDRFHF